jgi:hypothetical protein
MVHDVVVHDVVVHDVVVDHGVVMRVAAAGKCQQCRHQGQTRHGRRAKPLSHHDSP